MGGEGSAPDAPRDLTVGLKPDGSLGIAWKGSRTGVIFHIQRMLQHADGTTSAWSPLIWDGSKHFSDATVPVGTLSAAYAVKGIRAGKASDWSPTGAIRFAPDQQAGAAPDRKPLHLTAAA